MNWVGVHSLQKENASERGGAKSNLEGSCIGNTRGKTFAPTGLYRMVEIVLLQKRRPYGTKKSS
jgi:hypothetical protein